MRAKYSLYLAILLASSMLILIACSQPSNYQSIGPKASPPSAAKSILSGPTVIYGTDTRHDLYAESNPFVKLVADSTVAVLRTDDLTLLSDGSVKINQMPFGFSHMLCPTERFFSQGTAPYCTGFLIASDTVVSAGHCITSQIDCDDTSFVFGFSYFTPDRPPDSVPSSDVFRCKSVVHTQSVSSGADFSVVKLDRPVLWHFPLRVRSQGQVEIGDPMTVIGYPSGLPLKIADGAHVRRTDKAEYFVANLDTYGGNSGSPVFNSNTLEVEGVLVRGERDFTPTDNNCLISNICPTNGCRGEDVTRIREVLPYLD